MLTYLKHTEGDLFTLAQEGRFSIVVHGCNAQSVMGSGIAKQVKGKYPEAYRVYLKSQPAAGKWSSWDGPDFTIINAVTQIHYLPRGIDHFEYKAFETILEELSQVYPTSDFGFPLIGMGLAGGDANRIMHLLEQFAETIESSGGSATLVRYKSNGTY